MRRDLAFSRHAGVISAVQREYVTDGSLSREHHAALQRAFNNRNVADYEARAVTREVASETLVDVFLSARGEESRERARVL